MNNLKINEDNQITSFLRKNQARAATRVTLLLSFAFLNFLLCFTANKYSFNSLQCEMSLEEPPEVNGGQTADGSPRKSPKKMTVYPSTSEDIPLKEMGTEPSKTVRVSESYEDAIEKPSVAIKK